MFFAGEFAEIVTVAGLVTTLFFGGWQVPYLAARRFSFPWGGDLAAAAVAVVLLQVGGIRSQSGIFLLAADLTALERAALSLRSGHALGLEDAFAAGTA